MKVLEMMPQLDLGALATLHANALRLTEHGSAKQKEQASEALPLIEAEQARRAAEAPPKAKARKAAAPKKPAKSKAKAKAAAPGEAAAEAV